MTRLAWKKSRLSAGAAPTRTDGRPAREALRILFVNQYYPPDVSATAHLLGELTEGLARDHEVWVLAGRPSYNAEASRFRPRGVRLRRVWSTACSRRTMAGRILNYGSFFLGALIRGVTLPRPDVVVALTDPPFIGLVGMLTAACRGSRFVYVCMDIFPDVGVALGRVDHPVIVRCWEGCNRVVRRRADRVVAVGRDMNEKLRRDGVPHTKLEFISNWASIDVRRRDGAAEARRTMGWGDDFVVMHAGNVGLAQGLDALVDAAAMLPARPELRFVVLGDGAARESLERRAERSGVDKIDFVPYQPRERARDLMATADLHVISLRQGLAGAAVPSKVYEILALGRPFVAAVEPNSEIARIVEETGAGIRVDPGDAAALAASVLDFAEGSKDPSEAGRRGRAEFESKYTSELAIAKYRSLLEATQA